MTPSDETPGPDVRFVVLGDEPDDVRDRVEAATTWGTDGRLYSTWRGERYALRCARLGGTDPGDDDWLRRGDGPRPDDVLFVYWDD